MSDWVGFSDADLQRMKGEVNMNKSAPNKAKIVKPVAGGRQKTALVPVQRQQKRQNFKSEKQASKPQGNVPSAALLSKPHVLESENNPKVPSSPPTTPSDSTPLHGKTFTPPPGSVATNETNKETSKEPELVEDNEIIKHKEKLKFEDIQRRQKEMEEKNKRKKTMLTKAIAERKKKAFAESTKLVKIQAELAKLDDMLNYDVSILRDKIDEACWNFSNAQKRFEKAEAEYVDAKMNLHKATEMKEELTEHLYCLIQLNEERKADKLEDLMHKLELEDQAEDEKQAQSVTKDVSKESMKPAEINSESKTEVPKEKTQNNTDLPKSESSCASEEAVAKLVS